MDKNTTVYAKWTLVPERVTVNFNPANGDPATPVSVDKGSTLDNVWPTNPTRAGYGFGGWFAQPDGQGAQIGRNTVINASQDVYAHWTPDTVNVTVNFDPANGQPVTPVTLVKDALLGDKIPATPVRAGYDFGGWFTEPDGRGTPVTGETAATDTTVYAKWTRQTPPNVIVRFSTGSGQPRVVTVAQGSTLTDVWPPAPTLAGYDFGGWFTQDGTQYLRTSQVNADTDLQARWVPVEDKVLVVFDPVTGEMPTTAQVTRGALIGTNMPPIPVRAGYNFDGWYTADGQSVTAETAVDAETTAYARWVPQDQSVTLSFDPLNGDPAFTVAVQAGADASDRWPAEPSRQGYRFGGWFTGADGEGARYLPTSVITGDTALLAYWLPEDQMVTVTFDPANGEAISTAEVVKDSLLGPALPTIPLRPGYAFVGWYTEVDGAGMHYTEDSPVAADTLLYAYWTPVSQPLTVSFDPRNGDQTVSIAVVAGASVGDLWPTAPTRTGYTFSGWFTGVDGSGTRYYQDSQIDADTALYAHWVPSTQSVTVTFNPENGQAATTRSVVQNAQIGELPVPLRDGYSFLGWFTAPGEAGTQVTAASTVGADTGLYAHWAPIPVPMVSVSFDSGTGEAVVVSVPSGTAVGGSWPDDPVRDGFVFDGWFTEAGALVTASDPISAATALYARWTPVAAPTVSVSFDPLNGQAGSSVSVAVGSGLGDLFPAAPQRAGYVFRGWNTVADGSGQWVVATTPITGAMALSAVWDPVPVDTYSVTYDVDGVLVVVAFPAGTQVTVAAAPAKDGYMFVGWRDAAGVLRQPGDTFSIANAVALTAQWTELSPITGPEQPPITQVPTGGTVGAGTGLVGAGGAGLVGPVGLAGSLAMLCLAILLMAVTRRHRA